MDERESRVACVAQQQQALIRALLDDVIAEWLELDLTMAQLKALFTLDRQPGATVSALADQLGIKPPAASLLVDKLERAQLAVRGSHAGDGRRVVVSLTALGATLATRLRHGSLARLEGWIDQLSDSELEVLSTGISALAEIAWSPPSAPRLAPTQPV
jgi:DNA-binding MarR family transcriptional regulator